MVILRVRPPCRFVCTPVALLSFVRLYRVSHTHLSLSFSLPALLPGTVEAHYATGVALNEAGVVPGGDMTTEAALCKLGCLIGQGEEER